MIMKLKEEARAHGGCRDSENKKDAMIGFRVTQMELLIFSKVPL
jgi:hypothetical protein